MTVERRWLTAAEVGEYLNLHTKSVYRACRSHKIPYTKVPGIGVRIDRLELDSILERMGITPAEYGSTLTGEN